MYTNGEQHIRELARRVREAAHTPENIDKMKRYEDINALRTVIPPVSVSLPYQVSKLLADPLDFRTQEPYLRALEEDLAYRLARLDKLPDDTPVSSKVYTGFVSSVSEWKEGYHSVRLNERKEATCFKPCIHLPEDYQTLKTPVLSFDETLTGQNFQKMQNLLGDILTVVKGAPFTSVCGWGSSMVDQLVEMRGLEGFYYDMHDHPEAIHSAMEFMVQGHLRLLEEYEKLGMLVANNGINHVGSCSFGLSAELGVPSDQNGPVTPLNLWGYAHAQELASVSPDMLEEFVLPYQARILNRFGLNAYGCCEEIENKIDVVARHIDRLRMISISPTTNPEIAGEKCRGKYVYAWKTLPANIAYFNEQAIENEFRRVLENTKGCCVTVNIMDVYECGEDISRFTKAIRIAREMIDRYYSV